MSHFARTLKSLREGKGWNYQQLAERAGLAVGFVWRLEAGQRSPSLATAQKLADAFGVGIEVFSEKKKKSYCH